ncbi:WG repeat-containing protein [Corallibacter sp.]|uniref:WG repeat-containing protein n=1 Tax=Corallibacter sp. TaxID=2038084 RepID=UPI003AB50FB5
MKTKLLLFGLLLLSITGFTQELALARKDGKFGYITKAGEWHIKPQFKTAKNFSEDLAEATSNGDLWGYVNRKGEWVIQPQFNKTKAFNSGLAIVLKDKEWIYINTKGEQTLTNVSTDKLYDFSEGYAVIKSGDKIGFINTKGDVVISPKFTKAFDFVNGYSKVLENNKWGLVDPTGKYLVKTEYDGVSNFYNGNIVANKGETYGLIINGEFKPVSGANKIWDFSNNPDYTYAKKGEKVGFIDKKGAWIIEPSFDKVRAFKNGLAPVSNEKLWGYINLKGELIVPMQYRDAETFSDDGLAPVKTKKLWGFINKKGELVIPENYVITAGGFASLFSKNPEKGFIDGLARVKEKKSWMYIDTQGNTLKNMTFENLELFK